MDDSESIDYTTWGFITGIITFLVIWIYAISTWGLLLGLMFGWIPALIGGFLAGLVWPLVVIILVLGIILIFNG